MAALSFSCFDDNDCYNGGICESPLDWMFEYQDPTINLDVASSNVATSKKCICQRGFAGASCKDTCDIQCLNGGQCLYQEIDGGLYPLAQYVCNCPPNVSGPNCENSTGKGTPDDGARSHDVAASARGQPSKQGDNTLPDNGVSAGRLAGLLVLAILLLILLWRRTWICRKGKNMVLTKSPEEESATSTDVEDEEDPTSDYAYGRKNTTDPTSVNQDVDFTQPGTSIS